MIKKDFNERSFDDIAHLPPTLAERVAEAHAFFDPENLANLLLKYKGEVGLLVIDVQKKYCDPDHSNRNGNQETVDVSERVQSLVPAFRKAGIPVYAIHFGEPTDPSNIDFYKFFPEPEDTLVAKNCKSAFKGGNIHEMLQNDHKKLLLTCGFYLAQCVRETVHDAVRKGYDVCVLDDMTGEYKDDAPNRKYHLDDMRLDGIAVIQSDVVLKALNITQKAKAQTHKP